MRKVSAKHTQWLKSRAFRTGGHTQHQLLGKRPHSRRKSGDRGCLCRRASAPRFGGGKRVDIDLANHRGFNYLLHLF